MDMKGLLSMLGGGSANAAPSLYNTAATGGASGTGYIGNMSPDQFQGLLGMGQTLAGQLGGGQQQAQAPMPTPMSMAPAAVPQMPQGLFEQQNRRPGQMMGLMGGLNGY